MFSLPTIKTRADIRGRCRQTGKKPRTYTWTQKIGSLIFPGGGRGPNAGYCHLRICVGDLGVSIASRRRPSWPGRKSLLLPAASRPISATLTFNVSIT